CSFFQDSAPTELSTLSLHDALPISPSRPPVGCRGCALPPASRAMALPGASMDRILALSPVLAVRPELPSRHRAGLALRRGAGRRSEEHTSELQSRENLVCRLLLEKK